MPSRRIALLAGAGIITLSLSACGGSAESATTTPPTTATTTGSDPSTGSINVVASTDVWGDIVKTVGGDRVAVTSIISDPAQDPHSYEASATTQLELSKADVVIENGGGYDDFVDTMLRSHAKSDVQVLDAVTISGKTAPSGGELNEHVWYDVPTVAKVADQVAATLGARDPQGRAVFEANAATLKQQLSTLEAKEADLRKQHAGAGVAITEPVPLYLLEAAGLVDRTPEAFSEAVEEGTDVPPAVLDETLGLFRAKTVKALVYNEQTSGPETESVLKAAQQNGVPAVPVTETLPAGKDYTGWMTDNLNAVAKALA